MVNKSHAFLFSYLSENKTSNEFSVIALVHSALAGTCLLISSSKEIKSCTGLADSMYVLVCRWRTGKT